MKHKLTAVGWFCFSVLYLAGGWALKMGTLKSRARFFPRLVGVGLLVCTGVHLWQAFRNQRNRRLHPVPSIRERRAGRSPLAIPSCCTI
jgi:hypothetical protein